MELEKKLEAFREALDKLQQEASRSLQVVVRQNKHGDSLWDVRVEAYGATAANEQGLTSEEVGQFVSGALQEAK